MQNRTKRALAILAPVAVIGAVGLVHRLNSVHAAGGAGDSGGPTGSGRWYDTHRNRADVTVHGNVWDFYKKNHREMDPDFDMHGPKGLKGEYCDILRHHLDQDGKPVFSGGGYQVDRKSVV